MTERNPAFLTAPVQLKLAAVLAALAPVEPPPDPVPKPPLKWDPVVVLLPDTLKTKFYTSTLHIIIFFKLAIPVVPPP